MSKCDKCGQEGPAVSEEHSVNPDFCPAFIKRKAKFAPKPPERKD